jgi:hypothetical protein
VITTVHYILWLLVSIVLIGDDVSMYAVFCRSQWTHGLRHELSFLARTLGSWVRIPLKAWMSVSAFNLCFSCPVCRYFFYLVGWDLTPIRSLCRSPRFVKSQYCGHTLAYCTFSPDDTWGWLWSNWWSERRLQGKPKYSEKTCPAPLCLTTNPKCLGPVSSPGPQRWEASD